MEQCKIIANAIYDPRFIDVPELKDSVASRIRYARIKRKLSVKLFAELTQTSHETIWALESGKRMCPQYPLLTRMADVLEVSPIWLGGFDLMPETTEAEKIRKARYYRLNTIKEATEFFHVCTKTIVAWEHGKTIKLRDHLDDWLSVLEIPVQVPRWDD